MLSIRFVRLHASLIISVTILVQEIPGNLNCETWQLHHMTGTHAETVLVRGDKVSSIIGAEIYGKPDNRARFEI